MRVSAFWSPKAGHAAEEWEDAFCCDAGTGRFSVADGASESSFAGPWARLLAEGFVAHGTDPREWLAPARERWAKAVEGRTHSWYAEEKVRDGAHSSLLGLRLDDGRWRAVAAGDSCLFVVRRGRLVESFPLSRSADFDACPALVSSLDGAAEFLEREGEVRPADQLFLMTDAIAAWFLAEAEVRRRPWGLLERIGSPEEFGKFVELMRAGRSMRNDDVTMIRIEAP